MFLAVSLYLSPHSEAWPDRCRLCEWRLKRVTSILKKGYRVRCCHPTAGPGREMLRDRIGLRLTRHYPFDLMGNIDPGMDRPRKVGWHKKRGHGPLVVMWCGFNGRVFSSRHHRSVSKSHCCWMPCHGSTIWLSRACFGNPPLTSLVNRSAAAS